MDMLEIMRKGRGILLRPQGHAGRASEKGKNAVLEV